ncbi:uncharacterized protein LOC123557223 [Mercenaria mercenaria]|uniref:uncharacterized protein LOC123557223 n=1 Tax=Mercenaria mercenaria TaxID=6596 RepID=UPI001E1DFC2B|nr:uncharacterized protein LOC123557223 [Mercenaria mercenaria]
MTTTTDPTVEIVKPIEFGAINYVLTFISAILGVAFLIGVIVLIYKERLRSVEARIVDFKQKLNIRRKGISGKSMQRGTSSESITTSEATSYIQLTETPTSLRCSSAWTPSPVTRNSIISDTPNSADFNF